MADDTVEPAVEPCYVTHLRHDLSSICHYNAYFVWNPPPEFLVSLLYGKIPVISPLLLLFANDTIILR